MGSDKDIVWALTGSTAFIIQGMQFAPNDIDIQTNEIGAYAINEILMAYQTMTTAWQDGWKKTYYKQ